MGSNLVRLGIPTIAVVLAAIFVAGVWSAAKRAGLGPRVARRHAALGALGIAAFMAFIAALALSGVLRRFDLRPPPFALWALSTAAGGLGLGLSPLGKRLATELPFVALIGFQAFRLPLELVMHRAALEGVMPSVMSYSGYNFDIVTGVTALLLLLALSRGPVPRFVLVAWNLLGSVLLAVVVTIAFLATPIVRAFGDQQLNTWVAEFPYAWMSVMVGAALAGHVLVARKLARERAPRAAGASHSRAGT